VRTILETPTVPCIAPDGVFDAFGWCESTTLEWRAPEPASAWSCDAELTADNPPHMVFVMKADLPFLPRELACLHAPGLGLEDEWALAPYGIDDATDELYAHRAPPCDSLWLAADSVAGLFWGLHDWAHFHSHGPFTQRAWTELQCDVTALAWLWRNRGAIGLGASQWRALYDAALRIGTARFVEEGLTIDPVPPATIQGWAAV
jgi:hypothetical protein